MAPLSLSFKLNAAVQVLLLLFGLTRVSVGAQKIPEGICRTIAEAISPASRVSYPNDPQYEEDIFHWAASSSQNSTCTVEPATAHDVANILKTVGATRTPFGVKCGGHSANPSFSSTPGVLIVLTKFNQIHYHPQSQTVDIGAGLTWDDVYAALHPHNVAVLGGRVPGIGVAGFTLGGGYSWKTNQFGLSIDTVTKFELVKTDGSIVRVTATSDPELFFGLKGGGNNFGIVTKFTFKTFPQGPVWGGPITFAPPNLEAVSNAVAAFSANVTDPKAALIASYVFYQGNIFVSLLTFYDAPNPPPGIFDDFLEIPAAAQNLTTWDYPSLIKSFDTGSGLAGHRGVFHTVPLTGYSSTLLAAIVNGTEYWGKALASKSSFFTAVSVEPFLPSILSHTSLPSAYPPTRNLSFTPFNIYLAWNESQFDSAFFEASKELARHVSSVALAEGQPINHAALYPNYALFDTPLDDIYGANIPQLRTLKGKVDPRDVMGLAGGFKF